MYENVNTVLAAIQFLMCIVSVAVQVVSMPGSVWLDLCIGTVAKATHVVGLSH